MSLAEEHFERLSGSPEPGGYAVGEARDVLSGRPVRDEARELVYAKMLQLGSILIADSLKIKKNSSQLVIRSLPEGESSASAKEFPDGSFAIRVSYALLDALTSVANMAMMFERTVASAQAAFTRRGRQRQTQQAAAELATAMRAWIIMRRLTGTTQGLSFNLAETDSEFAAAIALEALQFVLAHEIAHISLKHTHAEADSTVSAGHINYSQAQELQADNLAIRMVSGQRPNQIAEAGPMWGVFLALLATEMTESAIYIRRNSTHPLAWARWGVIDKMFGTGPGREKSYQLALLAAFMAAIKLDEALPASNWTALQQAQITVKPTGLEHFAHLDHLLTAPINQMAERTYTTSSARGREVFALLHNAKIADAMVALRIKEIYIRGITDDRSAVAFFTIKNLIESACTNDALNPDPLLYSLTSTRLVARSTTGEAQDDR
jgi:hypothetical protein